MSFSSLNQDCLGVILGLLGPKSWGRLSQTSQLFRRSVMAKTEYQTTKQLFEGKSSPKYRLLHLFKVGQTNLAVRYYGEITTKNLFNLRSKIFFTVCTEGHLEVARWLLGLGVKCDNNLFTRAGPAEEEEEDEEEVHQPTRNMTAKEYRKSLGLRTISQGDTFRMTCQNGHLEVAKLVYSLDPDFNYHIMDDFIFRTVCQAGHLEIAQWFYSLDGKINLHSRNDWIFCSACNSGQLHVAQWLWSLDPAFSRANLLDGYLTPTMRSWLESL